jgi:hypothetical protein
LRGEVKSRDAIFINIDPPFGRLWFGDAQPDPLFGIREAPRDGFCLTALSKSGIL